MRQDPEPSSEESFAALLNGFSLDSSRRRGKPAEPEPPEPEPRPPEPPAARPVREVRAQEPEEDFEYPREEAASIVRAYSWTGGRTTSSFQLQIETLVSAVDWEYPPMKAEYQEVVALCGRPRSVAEVAALLRLPLGVAKVLLGDMAERGLIEVHQTALSDGDTPDLGLMERVLAGLRKL
ncbi:DUF742 domain-containing protein [Saccharothrix coeruleofusca]|uniref:DUF742 domain-containing protein n=1 Tax=Saccharothrix coeruleofusca TaxID=33919 RepID=A0A918EF59_9PSEU|nr:DUF742 domain-containing protein [Saccharothrix coeruleofusca]MBP2337758.1 hypothetical protein [Saccharothrix coeruleofusca]GGP62082.1 hypothetical protein GCM10010185_38050 [Saccharothrix coeruleofusca]